MANSEIVASELFSESLAFGLQIPGLKRPKLEELQEESPLIEAIEYDNSPEYPVTMKIGTVLRGGEEWIEDDEYKQRLVLIGNQVLGRQHLRWFLENQNQVPAEYRGKLDIDFSGLLVKTRGGLFEVFYADGVGRRWLSSRHWIRRPFKRENRIALVSER